MDAKQVLNNIQLFFKRLPDKIKSLNLGEKIALGMIGLGLLLIIFGLVLF